MSSRGRCPCCVGKVHETQALLLNKHIAIRNRLKYFDAVISPSAMLGQHTMPLTPEKNHELNVLQRRMLRSIVGWRRVDGEPWSGTMPCVSPQAFNRHPGRPWDQQLLSRHHNFAASLTASQWPNFVCKWDFACRWRANCMARAARVLGRPRAKWNDRLSKFRAQRFPNYVSRVDAARDGKWKLKRAEYIECSKNVNVDISRMLFPATCPMYS